MRSPPAAVQRLADRRVAAVNVVIGDDVAVAGRGRGEIGDVDRDRLRPERACWVRPAAIARSIARAVPLAGRRQQQGGEIADVLGADAAMAERAHRPAEQGLRRRVVQVDGVLVRHLDLEPAERVARPRRLADADRAAARGAPDSRRRSCRHSRG